MSSMDAESSHSQEKADAFPPMTEAVQKLKAILENDTHLFACGGKVLIREPQSSSQSEGDGATAPASEQRVSQPITIRYDNDGEPEWVRPCSKLTLPHGAGAEANLRELIACSQPATFGHGGEDVLDESYRKAFKLNPTNFSTTFDPYSLGIIDTIAQVLLPSVIDSKRKRSVRAELYKLNIYGPSGKIKPHVDTPNSSDHFGSLVVCLPTDYEGGKLKVRHEGEEMVYDWSTATVGTDNTAIRWVAFYNDCEHEVLEVTSGHRLTLTYNLYAVRGVGRLTGASMATSPEYMPLFHAVKQAVTQDPFTGQGGILGFWCSHTYAYNHRESPLPAVKGVDAVLTECLDALGVDWVITPVVEMSENDKFHMEEHYRRPEGYYRRLCDSDDGNAPDFPKERPSSEWIIGRRFGVEEIGYSSEDDGLYHGWGDYTEGPIQWLTKPPSHAEPQLQWADYERHPMPGETYSSCAIIVRIPPKGDDAEQAGSSAGSKGVEA